MLFSKESGVCPVCGDTGVVTSTWVMNKYGKRYEYFIYHHPNINHYSNKNPHNAKKFKKGELQKRLVEEINSIEFKPGSFRITDIRNSLIKEFPGVGYGSIKVSLNRLAEVGIIEKRKKGRSLYYVNTVSNERLSYTIDSLELSLEDVKNDGMFERHVFLYKIKNDHSWPLYYLPFQAIGDVDVKFGDLKMQAYESSKAKEINIVLLEDNPSDKRLLLRLPSPILPEGTRDIRIEYYWSEPKRSFVYSSATKMSRFKFSISGNNSIKLNVLLTSGSNNETKDLSSSVVQTPSNTWKNTNSFSLENLEAFTVIQLKWE